MNGFWLALGFLTTLPARPVPYVPGGLGRAAAWFPVIGLLIGLLLLLVQVTAARLLGPPMAAVLAVAAWAVLTGGLHLDGLADCCDGLLVSAPRERRLEIMRDPRVGSFAVSGLVLALLLKTAAVFSLGTGSAAALGLILAPVLGALVDPPGGALAFCPRRWSGQQLCCSTDAPASGRSPGITTCAAWHRGLV